MSWLEELTPAALDERWGSAKVTAALSAPHVYAGPPYVDSKGQLVGTLIDSRGRKLGSPMKVVVRVDKTLSRSCACRSSGICEHVEWLLVDVAFHEALRKALARGAAPMEIEAHIDELSDVRARAVEQRTLDERLAAWLPPSRVVDDLEIDIEVIAITAAASTNVIAGEGRAAILVRHRRVGARREILSAKDVLAARLTPRRRRLVELMTPYHMGRDALIATRGQASLVVSLLREELTGVWTGGFKSTVRYAPNERHVVPSIERRDDRVVATWVDEDGRSIGDASDTFLVVGPAPHLWVPSTRTFHVVSPDVDLDVALGMQRVPSLPAADGDRERVGRALLGRARRFGVRLPEPEVFGLPPLIKPSFELRLDGTPLEVTGELFAIYEGVGRLAITSELEDARDIEAEEAAVREVIKAGFAWRADGGLVAAEDGAVALWRGGIDALRASEEPRFSVTVASSIANTKVAPPVSIDVRVRAEAGWLDTELEFRAGALKVEMRALEAALREKQSWVVLDDGSLARIVEAVSALVAECHEINLADTGGVKLPPHQLARIARWIELADSVVTPSSDAVVIRVTLDEHTRALRDRLLELARQPSARLPAALSAETTLRPYQLAGVAWLEVCRELGVGGLLADDMGLGKTLMTLCLLARAKEDAEVTGQERLPSLVVCPTSVLGNWVREAARFVPSLEVTAFVGARRRSLPTVLASNDASTPDVFLMTYGVFRREIDRIAARRFRVVVLDEAQNIKNPASATARASRRLDAETRVALSGTPIENRLSELWSLMTFANPGMLGTAAEFDDRYERPIAVRPDGAIAGHLRTIVRPFILRRTKDQVLTELPPKTEIDRTCVFGARQKKLYDALAQAMRKFVATNMDRRRGVGLQMSVLTAILRLRQMACDPRLIDPDEPAETSAKRAVFLELVRELVSEERRAIVFSQFVELLTLWRRDLDDAKIAYEYLDGSTRDRDAVVSRFQRGTAPLFLVSLKAGGAGLNLTAADTVILVDPWWNPAVEEQAADRAHRIGQTKPVTIVRLVAEGTIEDKMALLQENKRALRDAILSSEGTSPIDTAWTEAEIEALLGDATLEESLFEDIAPND